jgi:hypothetical protein
VVEEAPETVSNTGEIERVIIAIQLALSNNFRWATKESVDRTAEVLFM